MQNAWAERLGDVTVVHMGREYGSTEVGRLRSAEQIIARCTEETSRPYVVLDLGRVTYCGSAFLNLLVRCYRRVRAQEGRFAVCGTRGLTRQILLATRVQQLWETYNTSDEAVRALGGR